MRKIIKNGKRYDTETATELAKFWNNLSYTDFNYIHETLYRTPKGNFFLLADGGANTKYSVVAGNMSSGSSDNIIPLSENEAFNWLERHGKTQLIEKYFSDRIVDA